MTKAQMAERIAELEKEVEALKAGASVETHVHYHYPQPEPQQYIWFGPDGSGSIKPYTQPYFTWTCSDRSSGQSDISI